MNKYIKRLVEGLFDDWDEIADSDDIGLSQKLVTEPALNYIKQLLFKEQFDNRYGWFNSEKYEKKIYEEIEGDAIAFYFNEINGSTQKRHYITHLDIDEEYTLKQVNELFENFEIIGIKYVMMTICVRQKRYTDMNQDQASQYKVDFRNIQFISITANGINPINVTVNQSEILSQPLYSKAWTKSEYDSTNNYINFIMNHSTWNDSINIEDVGYITLQSTFNLKDYSFIKKITKAFELIPYGPDQVASCNCLKGLPNGNYSVRVIYRSNNNDEAYNNMERQTLVGIPETVSELKVSTEVNPLIILHKISFEGLTPAMQSRFEFVAHKFPGKYKPLNIQFGPYNLQFKGRKWSPNKPHLTQIIALQDWFLDCYSDKPHEEYKAPENEKTQKILQSEQKKIDKVNQEVQDKKDDLEKMVKNAKKYIKNGSQYYDSIQTLKVTDVTDTHIKFIQFTRRNIINYTKSYINFIEFLKSHPYLKVGKEEDSDKLYDLIIAPVERSRERILKKRKKEAAEQRKAETAARREAKKAEEAAAKEAAKKEKEVSKGSTSKTKRDQIKEPIKPEVKQEIKAQIKQDSKIKIYDYSDRAIAVYGDTWTIKDKLKELGCKYNKFLTINGKKTPGWIISNKKRKEVEEIINSSKII